MATHKLKRTLVCSSCHGDISDTAPRLEMFGQMFCDRDCRNSYVDDNTTEVNFPRG